MIEVVNGTITIPNWEKHQSLDVAEKQREQSRERIESRFADYIQHLRTAHLSGVTLISGEGHFFVVT